MSIAMVMAGPGEGPRPQSRPVPQPGPGEAVVAVRASSMNYHDLVNLMGFIRGPWPRVPVRHNDSTEGPLSSHRSGDYIASKRE